MQHRSVYFSKEINKPHKSQHAVLIYFGCQVDMIIVHDKLLNIDTLTAERLVL